MQDRGAKFKHYEHLFHETIRSCIRWPMSWIYRDYRKHIFRFYCLPWFPSPRWIDPAVTYQANENKKIPEYLKGCIASFLTINKWIFSRISVTDFHQSTRESERAVRVMKFNLTGDWYSVFRVCYIAITILWLDAICSC